MGRGIDWKWQSIQAITDNRIIMQTDAAFVEILSFLFDNESQYHKALERAQRIAKAISDPTLNRKKP